MMRRNERGRTGAFQGEFEVLDAGATTSTFRLLREGSAVPLQVVACE